MKNFLTHLTGIVFVITILIAGSCQPNGTEEERYTILLGNDTTVIVYLKDTLLLDGRVHLEMGDSKKPGKKVIDSLETVVSRGDIVIWQKAHKSNIKSVDHIRLIEADSTFSISRDSIALMSLYTLTIPDSAKFDTLKYEIVFTVKKDGEDEKETTWCIDPYLRIED